VDDWRARLDELYRADSRRILATLIRSVEVRPVLEPGIDTADPLDRRLAAAMAGKRRTG
jgi:hypothetical protein